MDFSGCLKYENQFQTHKYEYEDNSIELLILCHTLSTGDFLL